MQSPQQQRKSFRQIWRDAGKAGRCGLIVAGLVIVGSMCLCVNVIAVNTPATPSSTPTTIAQNSEGKPSTRVPLITPTHTSTGVRHLTPTTLPTNVPKPAPTLLPTPKPTSAPQPAPTQPPAQTGVNGNPWGYNFTPGNYIYNPPATFCGYFACIASFWTSTNGYVDECVDGTYSHSGGVRGACSHHGGELRPLYSH